MDWRAAFTEEQRWRNAGEWAIRAEMERRIARRFARKTAAAPDKVMVVRGEPKPLGRDGFQPSNADLRHYNRVHDWLEKDR